MGMATLTVTYRNHLGATQAIRNIVERNGGTGWGVDGDPEGDGALITATASVDEDQAESLAQILNPEKSGVVQSVDVS